MGNHRIEDTVHLLMGFTHGQAAHSIAVQLHLADCLCMPDADILVNCSLIDSKEELLTVHRIRLSIQAFQLFPAAFKPSCGSVYRGLDVFP